MFNVSAPRHSEGEHSDVNQECATEESTRVLHLVGDSSPRSLGALHFPLNDGV